MDSRLFELCMRLRYREVNGKGSDASAQVSFSFQHTLASGLVEQTRSWIVIALSHRPFSVALNDSARGLWQDMRQEMLALSTKSERPDHVNCVIVNTHRLSKPHHS